MAEGAGEAARCMGEGDTALGAPPLGGGEGTRKVDSALSGDEEGGFLMVPGAFAVFMLEYGENFFLAGLSCSGVLPLDELQPSSRYPNSL